ncbi:hypothetical protein [Streptomyces sp. ODS28]|uniref:hypothetical protein n=1 Tax=Streptomyces sp. ODS28 TaxID=3136688 RepID=UPI0031E8A60F
MSTAQEKAPDFAVETTPERAERAAQFGEEHRSRRDLQDSTPGEWFKRGAATVGISGVLLTGFAWLRKGPWLPVNWAATTATLLILTGTLLAGTALALRSAGRLGGARACVGAIVLAIPCAALAITTLPQHALFTCPAPIAGAVALLLAAAAWKLPSATADRWFEGDERALRRDDEAWLRRLYGLLRGRHGLRPVQARTRVEEARGHVAAAGGGAYERFGPVHRHALRLADGPGRPHRATLRDLRSSVLFLPVVLVAGADAILHPDLSSFWTWLVFAAVAYWLYDIVRQWQRCRSGG